MAKRNNDPKIQPQSSSIMAKKRDIDSTTAIDVAQIPSSRSTSKVPR